MVEEGGDEFQLWPGDELPGQELQDVPLTYLLLASLQKERPIGNGRGAVPGTFMENQGLCARDVPGKNTGGLPFPSAGYLPRSGIEPVSPVLTDRLCATEPAKPFPLVLSAQDSLGSTAAYLAACA